MKPVAIFAATRWELRALYRALPTHHSSVIAGARCQVGQRAGQTYWLVQTGIGPNAARRAASAVMEREPLGAVISAGFACALITARVGDLIVGTEAVSVQKSEDWMMKDDAVRCNDAMRERAVSAAMQAGIPLKSGKILSATIVVSQARDKRRLHDCTGAIALDMESAALGSIAARCGLPFMVVRTVSDLVDEDLPLDFNLFLRPTGWLKGTSALLAHPASLIGINRLRKQSRTAADRLTRLFEAYVAVGFGLEQVRS